MELHALQSASPELHLKMVRQEHARRARRAALLRQITAANQTVSTTISRWDRVKRPVRKLLDALFDIKLPALTPIDTRLATSTGEYPAVR